MTERRSRSSALHSTAKNLARIRFVKATTTERPEGGRLVRRRCGGPPSYDQKLAGVQARAKVLWVALDLTEEPAQLGRMSSPARNQDIRNAVLALLLADIKSSPRLVQFRRFTKEPVKLAGFGKITVPDSVWHDLAGAPELAAFAISFNHDHGTSPEFTMDRLG